MLTALPLDCLVERLVLNLAYWGRQGIFPVVRGSLL